MRSPPRGLSAAALCAVFLVREHGHIAESARFHGRRRAASRACPRRGSAASRKPAPPRPPLPRLGRRFPGVLPRVEADADELDELLRRHLARDVGAVEDLREEAALVRLQALDLLLDRVLRDEANDRHRPLLPHAVRAVRRLILDRRVPPRVGVDDVVGRGEVEARPSRHERDEEDVRLLALEGLDPAPALLGGSLSVEREERKVIALELRADEVEVARELAEDERAMAALAKLLERL